MMTTDLDWRSRLAFATDALEKSATAPQWLKSTLREALAVAEDLEPEADTGPMLRDHVYPH